MKQRALELGIDVRTPPTLRDDAERDALTALAPDIGVVAAYGLILPPEILAIPARGFVNVHASLLPRWRGAAPVQRAILAGDAVTGVSIMRMEAGLDTGSFCEIAQTPVGDKNAEALTGELARLGALALVRALARIAEGTCTWHEQDDSLATYAEKVTKEDVRLSPDLPADELLRRIRASNRQAPARLAVAGSTVTVIEATASDATVPPATARRERDTLLLGTARGAIELKTVKPEARTPMDVGAWLRGTRIDGDTAWASAS